MKKFIYHVQEVDFEDTEAFGKAWEQAKNLATERHCPIYRTIIEEKNDVFCEGGFFLATNRLGEHISVMLNDCIKAEYEDRGATIKIF